MGKDHAYFDTKSTTLNKNLFSFSYVKNLSKLAVSPMKISNGL